jgi:hypothetical protein
MLFGAVALDAKREGRRRNVGKDRNEIADSIRSGLVKLSLTGNVLSPTLAVTTIVDPGRAIHGELASQKS